MIEIFNKKWPSSLKLDSEDFSLYQQYSWYIQPTGYLAAYIEGRTIGIHVLIMKTDKSSIHIDHKNSDRLDNRKENLRHANHSQNQQNANKQDRNTTSKYKGVYWRKQRGRWTASIKKNGKTLVLGTFRSEIKAAQAYDEAAKNIFGEFAKLNFQYDK